MRSISLYTPLAFALLAACGGKGDGEDSETTSKKDETPRKLAGVFPQDFDCKSIATLDQIGDIMGGKAAPNNSASETPRGVPHPCAYEIVMPNGSADYWTFDFDCRDNYKRSADALFAQYKQTSGDFVKAYNAEAEAGIKPNDAGVAVRPPEEATVVDVGAKALDHHGRGLIFIDDDAPCYVRVVGTDAVKRFELAKLVSKNLTYANAPMSPRPFP